MFRLRCAGGMIAEGSLYERDRSAPCLSKVVSMMPRRKSDPDRIPPTTGQIRGAFWLSTIGAIGFWWIYASIIADLEFPQSVLALGLPLLVTYGAVSLYLKNRWLLRRAASPESDR